MIQKLSSFFYSASAEEELLIFKKRLVKACLAPAIMVQLAERGLLSPRNILLILEKRYSIKLSAGTVYPILEKLEKNGDIKRVPNRSKRLYIITGKGKKVLQLFQEKISELNYLIGSMIAIPSETISTYNEAEIVVSAARKEAIEKTKLI